MPVSGDSDSGAVVPGWYGKIASLGDFASRRLPSQVVARLDGWLQDMIAGSRARLGEDWLDTYLTSSIWRFLLFPDVLDGDCWAGLLMPSVDKVGRYFPLCIAALVADSRIDMRLLGTLDAWLSRLETVALDTLDTSVSVQQFDEAVCATSLDVGISPGEPSPLADRLLEGLRTQQPLLTTIPGPGAVGDALSLAGSGLFLDLARGAGVWWSAARDSESVRVLLCRDLPDVDQYVAMLRGHVM